MANGTAAFTKDKLKKMEASGRVPVNLDRDQDATEDNYGFTAARGSNSAQLKRGGAAKPHMGRPGRASGGKVVHDRDMNKASTDVTHLPDLPKLRARGGRTHNAEHRHHRAEGGETPNSFPRNTATPRIQPDDDHLEPSITAPNRYSRGELRKDFARGGRAGRGKTVVNVIVGRGGPPQGAAPMPPPMAAPPPPMPPPPPSATPPRPPMPVMPVGNAPMGPMGAPPGGMPMRARGGKIPGPKDGGNGGLGRLAKAKEEGARY